MRASGCASTRSSRRLALIEQILDRLPAGADPRRAAPAAAGDGGEGLALVEGFRGDVLVWVRLGAGRHGRALPPARSVLVPVAAAGGGDRGQHRRRLPALQQILQLLLLGPRSLRARAMRKLLFESLLQAAAHRGAAARATMRRSPSWRRASSAPRAAGSAAACRSARSMPAPATAASWRSTRSTMPSTTSSASACASSPRRATPTCCWSPARSPRTCARRWSAPMPRRPTRNGWWRSATAPLDGGVFAGSYAVRRRRLRGRAGRSPHPRLPADADGAAQGAARAGRGRFKVVPPPSSRRRECAAARSRRKAGTHARLRKAYWVPTFVGMTNTDGAVAIWPSRAAPPAHRTPAGRSPGPRGARARGCGRRARRECGSRRRRAASASP